MRKIYAHQKEIIEEDKPKSGIFLGTGSGKSFIALYLSKGRTLVLAPKTQVQDRNWNREFSEIENSSKRSQIYTLTVASKDTFRKDWDKAPKCDTLILDEAHTMLGVNPTQAWRKRERVIKTSQVFDAIRMYINKVQPQRIYIVTATPVRNPMCVWAAATLLGHKWDFVKFRDTFYFRLPMPGREVYRPRTDKESKVRLAKAVQKLGYTGKLDEWFDVPEQTDKVVYVHMTDAQTKRLKSLKVEYPDPLTYLGKRHQVENGVLMGDEYKVEEEFSNEKIDKISDLCAEFPKVVVFAKYLNQIAQIHAELTSQGKRVFCLTGNTKNRGKLIADANACDECAFIAQAQVSSGYELPTFNCVVYASMSYSLVDLEQSRGRVLRANALKKNLYVYLVMTDGIDQEVYDTLMTKKDFNEAIFIKNHPEMV